MTEFYGRMTGNRRRYVSNNRRQTTAVFGKIFCEEKTWYPDYFGCKFAAYMMFFCGIIGWLFPYQAEWVSIHESMKTYGIYAMIYLLGFSFYSQMFTSYKGSKRSRNLSEILQNLPVSSVQTAIFKAKKTLKICGRIAVIAAVGQTFLHDCGITYFFNRKYIDSACGIIRSSGRNLCRGNCS